MTDQYAGVRYLVDDVQAAVDFYTISGPGGRQILIADPAGNLIELFEPARRPATTATPH